MEINTDAEHEQNKDRRIPLYLKVLHYLTKTLKHFVRKKERFSTWQFGVDLLKEHVYIAHMTMDVK